MEFNHTFSLDKDNRINYLTNMYYIICDMRMEIEQNDEEIINNGCQEFGDHYYELLDNIEENLMGVLKLEHASIDPDYI